MGKKDRGAKFAFECPVCRRRLDTRNTRPKCPWCSTPLIIKSNGFNQIKVSPRNGKTETK